MSLENAFFKSDPGNWEFRDFKYNRLSQSSTTWWGIVMRNIFRGCAPRTARVLISRLHSQSVLRFSFVTLLIIAVLGLAAPDAQGGEAP